MEHDEEYVVARADGDAVPEMVRRLVAEGIDVRAVLPAVEQGLEDFFLELTTSSDRGSAKPAGEPAMTGQPETPGTPVDDGRAGS